MFSTFSQRMIARRLVRVVTCGMVMGSAVGLAGCHGLLDVSDPTLIQSQTIANSAGAMGWRVNALQTLSLQMAPTAYESALLSDERSFDPGTLPNPPYANPYLNYDKRDATYMALIQAASYSDRHLGQLDLIVSTTTQAINAMRANGSPTVKDEYLGELFAVRGYAILQMAEEICSGFPINDVAADRTVVLSGPYTTDSATKYALMQTDSALAHGHDSTQFVSLASVVRGRALMDLGYYAEASAAVANVPTSFTYMTDPSVIGNIFAWNTNGCCEPVGEREGGNGLPFVSANDPRVPTYFSQMGVFNPSDSLFDQSKYPDNNTPIVLASGIEARLIQAEAALNASNPSAMVDTLNALRATIGLGTLSVPSTQQGQVDLLYSERAFWLYLTARRVGDLRRLIKNYGRDPESVFPTGPYRNGGSFGNATSFPFTVAVQGQFNPKITTGCAVP